MNKNIYDLEIIMLSTYSGIVLEILKIHKNLSVSKMITFAYLMKKKKVMNSSVYNASNKNDIVLKCLSQLSGLFEDYCGNIKFIIDAIHLLIINNKITQTQGELIYIETGEIAIEDNSFLHIAIRDSKKYSDSQFLKEVVKHV